MSSLLRIVIAALAMMCVWLLSGPAAAQPEDDNKVAASETFRAAAAAFERGDFEAAARSFEVSHRLLPHPNAIYNAGRAWQEAGKSARAADALTLALAMDDLSDEQRADAESRLSGLRPLLAIVHLIGPAGTTFSLAHAEGKQTPSSVHVLPGEHVVKAKFSDGRTSEQTVKVGAPGLEVELELAPSAPEAPKPQPEGEPPQPPTPQPQPDTTTVRNEAQWTAGWVLLGAGVVSGVFAIGLGVAALGSKDEFEQSGNTDADAHDRAATFRTTTNVLWATAGALSLTGVLLLVFSDEDAPAEDQALRVHVGPASLSLTGAW